MKHLIALCLTLTSFAHASIDPFSKIVITSDKACGKSVKNTQAGKHVEHFIVDYTTNVRVTFADNSTVTSDKLTAVFEGAPKGLKKEALRGFKKITFLNNVRITHGIRTATADKADLILGEKKCLLEGNVKIRQTKQKQSDIPISIDSQKAEFCFDDKQISLIGSSSCPVSTTIVLEGHPSVMYKKDLKKKKSHGKHKSPSTGNSA